MFSGAFSAAPPGSAEFDFLTWEAAGCPQPGSRPGEGDHVFTRDGVKVLRYAVTVPLVGSTGRLGEAAMYAGMGVGEVRDLPPAGELVKRLWSEAEAAHRSARSGKQRA